MADVTLTVGLGNIPQADIARIRQQAQQVAQGQDQQRRAREQAARQEERDNTRLLAARERIAQADRRLSQQQISNAQRISVQRERLARQQEQAAQRRFEQTRRHALQEQQLELRRQQLALQRERFEDRFAARQASRARAIRNLTVGAFATVGVTGFAAATTAAVRTLADFEQAMASVRAVTGATQQQFDALSEEARRLGATTRFTGTQAAEGMLFLARAGFDAEQSLAAVESTLLLAQAGALDLGRAADIASNLLTQFRLDVSELTRVVDVLSLAANSSNQSVEQLGLAMSFVGQPAQALGISVEETAAALGVLANAGIQAERGGTGLRRVLFALIDPTNDALEAFDRLGISLDELNVRQVGIEGVFRRFAEAGAEFEDFAQIFGVRGAGIAEGLSASVDQLRTFTGELENAGGTAQRVAEVMDDNLRGSLLRVASAFEAVVLSAGEAGGSAGLQGFLDSVAAGLRGLSSAITTINRELRQEVDFAAIFGDPAEIARSTAATQANAQAVTDSTAARERLANIEARLAEASGSYASALRAEAAVIRRQLAPQAALANAIEDTAEAEMAVADASEEATDGLDRQRRATRQKTEEVEDLTRAYRDQIEADRRIARANLASADRLEAGNAALREETRIRQEALSTGASLEEVERQIALARLESQAATDGLTARERELLRERADLLRESDAARDALDEARDSTDMLAEAQQNAILTTGDLRDAWGEMITGILRGTRDISDIGDTLRDLASGVGAQLFEGLLFGKEGFDRTLIGNFQGLFGQGGILGGIIQGGILGEGGLFGGTGGGGILGSLLGGGGAGGGGLLGRLGISGLGSTVARLSGIPSLFGAGRSAGLALSGLPGGVGPPTGFQSFAGNLGGIAALGLPIAGGLGANALLGSLGFQGGGLSSTIGSAIGTAIGTAVLGPVGALFGSFLGGAGFGALFGSMPTRIELEKDAIKDAVEEVYLAAGLPGIDLPRRESNVEGPLAAARQGPLAFSENALQAIGTVYALGVEDGGLGTVARFRNQTLAATGRAGLTPEQQQQGVQALAQSVGITSAESFFAAFNQALQGGFDRDQFTRSEVLENVAENQGEDRATRNRQVRLIATLAGGIDLINNFAEGVDSLQVAADLTGTAIEEALMRQGRGLEEYSGIIQQVRDGSLQAAEALTMIGNIEFSDLNFGAEEVVGRVEDIQGAAVSVVQAAQQAITQGLAQGLERAEVEQIFSQNLGQALQDQVVQQAVDTSFERLFADVNIADLLDPDTAEAAIATLSGRVGDIFDDLEASLEPFREAFAELALNAFTADTERVEDYADALERAASEGLSLAEAQRQIAAEEQQRALTAQGVSEQNAQLAVQQRQEAQQRATAAQARITNQEQISALEEQNRIRAAGIELGRTQLQIDQDIADQQLRNNLAAEGVPQEDQFVDRHGTVLDPNAPFTGSGRVRGERGLGFLSLSDLQESGQLPSGITFQEGSDSIAARARAAQQEDQRLRAIQGTNESIDALERENAIIAQGLDMGRTRVQIENDIADARLEQQLIAQGVSEADAAEIVSRGAVAREENQNLRARQQQEDQAAQIRTSAQEGIAAGQAENAILLEGIAVGRTMLEINRGITEDRRTRQLVQQGLNQDEAASIAQQERANVETRDAALAGQRATQDIETLERENAIRQMGIDQGLTLAEIEANITEDRYRRSLIDSGIPVDEVDMYVDRWRNANETARMQNEHLQNTANLWRRILDEQQRVIDIESTRLNQLAQIGAISDVEAISGRRDLETQQAIQQVEAVRADPNASIEQINAANDALNRLAQTVVRHYQAQERAIQEQLRAEIDAAREASQARIDALNAEQDALRTQLATAQEFAQVAESARGAIAGLLGDTLAPDDQFEFLSGRAASLRQQLSTASPEDQAGIAGQLIQTLTQLAQAQPFAVGDIRRERVFNDIRTELEMLEEFASAQASDADRLEAAIMANEEAIVAEQQALAMQIERLEAAAVAAIDILRERTIDSLNTIWQTQQELDTHRNELLGDIAQGVARIPSEAQRRTGGVAGQTIIDYSTLDPNTPLTGSGRVRGPGGRGFLTPSEIQDQRRGQAAPTSTTVVVNVDQRGRRMTMAEAREEGRNIGRGVRDELRREDRNTGPGRVRGPGGRGFL